MRSRHKTSPCTALAAIKPYSHARQRRGHKTRAMHAVHDDSAAVALRKAQRPPFERRGARWATRLCTR
eukprot:4266890-Prymnesium_polylepis.1